MREAWNKVQFEEYLGIALFLTKSNKLFVTASTKSYYTTELK